MVINGLPPKVKSLAMSASLSSAIPSPFNNPLGIVQKRFGSKDQAEKKATRFQTDSPSKSDPNIETTQKANFGGERGSSAKRRTSIKFTDSSRIKKLVSFDLKLDPNATAPAKLSNSPQKEKHNSVPLSIQVGKNLTDEIPVIATTTDAGTKKGLKKQGVISSIPKLKLSNIPTIQKEQEQEDLMRRREQQNVIQSSLKGISKSFIQYKQSLKNPTEEEL